MTPIMGMALVSAGWTPVRHDFSLRGIVRGTTEPHKLKQLGATPSPATISQSSCQRDPVKPDRPASMSCRQVRQVGVDRVATVGAGILFRVSPCRASLSTPYKHDRSRLLPWLARVFSVDRSNRRTHRLAFFLSLSPAFRRRA